MARTKVTGRDLGRACSSALYGCKTAVRVAKQCAAQERYAAAAAAAPVLPCAGLEALPEDVQCRIFLATPADARMRASGVCRSWAAFLKAPKLWQTLDLSPSGGVARGAVSSSLLCAAAARACGTLHTLDVSDCLRCGGDTEKDAKEVPTYVSMQALATVLAANARTLRVLRALCGASLCESEASGLSGLQWPKLFRLLRAAPLLDALHADVACLPDQALDLVRCAGSALSLRLRRLVHEPFQHHGVSPELLASLGTHASLCELVLEHGVHLEGEECVGALALRTNVTGLGLSVGFEALKDTTLPQLLEQLFVADGPLRSLRLFFCEDLKDQNAGGGRSPEPGSTSAQALGEVLAALPLRALSADWYEGTERDSGTAATLVARLRGHGTLQRLWLRHLPDDGFMNPAAREYAPRLLTLLLGDAPALTSLYISSDAFEIPGDFTSLLVEALARSSAVGAGGAPRLRQLSLPARGLEALDAADVRAAAPALRSLPLLRRLAVHSWLPTAELMDE